MACNIPCATGGFVVGSDPTADALATYTDWVNYSPIADGHITMNNVGSMYKKIGDQVYLNINIVFVASSATTEVVITAPTPYYIQYGNANGLVRNGAIVQHGYNDPATLINAVIHENTISSLKLFLPIATVIGDTYILNAQVVYTAGI